MFLERLKSIEYVLYFYFDPFITLSPFTDGQPERQVIFLNVIQLLEGSFVLK